MEFELGIYFYPPSAGRNIYDVYYKTERDSRKKAAPFLLYNGASGRIRTGGT